MEYDGQPHGATVTVAEGVGTPTLSYAKNAGYLPGAREPIYEKLNGQLPTQVGEYIIYLSIAEGEL